MGLTPTVGIPDPTVCQLREHLLEELGFRAGSTCVEPADVKHDTPVLKDAGGAELMRLGHREMMLNL